jgi:hypothetical protein
VVDGFKVCNKCKQSKATSEFYARKTGKICARESKTDEYNENRGKILERGRIWRAENPVKSRHYYNTHKELIKLQRIKRKYGINPEKYLELIRKQGNRCVICNVKFAISGNFKPVVDHCHKRGHIRAIICQRCNQAEGLLETPEIARAVLSYMEENELLSYGK